MDREKDMSKKKVNIRPQVVQRRNADGTVSQTTVMKGDDAISTAGGFRSRTNASGSSADALSELSAASPSPATMPKKKTTKKPYSRHGDNRRRDRDNRRSRGNNSGGNRKRRGNGKRVATFKHGQVSVTDNQVKIHRSQISELDLERIMDRIDDSFDNGQKLRLTRHVKDKIYDGEIDLYLDDVKDILDDLSTDKIIEYNERTFESGEVSQRALIRSDDVVNCYVKKYKKNKDCNLCVVVDVNTLDVVTAYYNAVDDNHDNINMDRYDENLKVLG